MSLIAGRATIEGTTRFARRAVSERKLAPDHFREAIGEPLRVSSLGLGTYLGDADGPTDTLVEQATQICLASGRINAVDTALNYRFQRAERSVGRAVRRCVENGTARRDEVFVATKNGYLAPDGESTLPPSEWIQRELVRPGILKPSDIVDGSHAMSVRFLADQLGRSRRNLGLETIDLVYLHNAADAQLARVGSEEFFARLADAFAFYEGERSSGNIGAYGLATWESLRTHRSAPGYLALEPLVGLARKAGGPNHGFRFIQFPFNLLMPEAAILRNQTVGGERRTLFEAARALGLNCFTSVPLLQGQLADAARNGTSPFSAAQNAIQFARSAPGTLAPLIGQKQAEHLSENLEVASHPPWDPDTFQRAVSQPDARLK